MSLILDALKKADQERRERDQAPSLDSAPSASPSKRSYRPLIAAAVAILVLAALFYFFFAKPETSNNSTELPVNAASENNPQPSPDVSEARAEQERLSELRKKYQEAQNKKKRVDTPSANPAQSSEVDELYSQAERQDNPKSEATPTANVESAGANEIQRPVPVVLSKFEQAKTIKQLSFSVQEKIPSLMYEEHSFSRAGRSSIKINGRVLRENATFSGIKLVSIHEQGAIFSYQDQEFKLPAMNSWINLN